jgi:hypothetical protein
MTVERWPSSRFWAVYDDAGGLICLAVYKRGAFEVVRRIEKLQGALERLTEALKNE